MTIILKKNPTEKQIEDIGMSPGRYNDFYAGAAFKVVNNTKSHEGMFGIKIHKNDPMPGQTIFITNDLIETKIQ